MIYGRPILAAVYCIDFPVTVPNLYLFPALYPVSTTYEDEAITNIYKNPFPIATKRPILELSRSLGQLYYRILLNVLDVVNPDF